VFYDSSGLGILLFIGMILGAALSVVAWHTSGYLGEAVAARLCVAGIIIACACSVGFITSPPE
jgi:hypothetical protein